MTLLPCSDLLTGRNNQTEEKHRFAGGGVFAQNDEIEKECKKAVRSP
jgi:hypothetical protein